MSKHRTGTTTGAGSSNPYRPECPGKQIVIKHAPKQLAAVKLAEGSVSENEMVENHEASKQSAHADVYVAIRDAFDAAGRKLQDYVRRQRGAVKKHERATHVEE